MTMSNDVTKKTKCLALLFFLIGGIFFSAGCQRSDGPVKEKTASSETNTREDQGKDDHDTVTLTAERQKMAGIEVRTLALESVSAPLSATAVIALNADRVSKISSRVTGKVIQVTATQGQRVRAGQTLARMDTVDLDQVWSEYMKGKSKQELAAKTLQREETLFAKGVCPEKDVLKARQELSEAEADLALANEKFRLLGVEVVRVETQKSNGLKGHPLISISSPLSGVITEKSVTPGEMVGPEKVLFIVADLSTLWVSTHFYEKDIPFLKAGLGVKISVAAFPDRDFTGVISYIGDVVDEKSRTVTARVTIPNGGGLLKPGMFATVLIDTRTGEKQKLLGLPEEAVVIDGSAHYVFVQSAPGKFKKSNIKPGRTLGKTVEILEGLKAGDLVVTKGAFTLKSELKKETLHADEH
jgi:cobalt-zinc-cadmium efflux system membrane fusion protein